MARDRPAPARLSARDSHAHPAVTDPPHSASEETNQSLGGSLVRVVDVAGVEHLAYPTARRTLCLERLVAECLPKQPVTAGTCATCTQARKRMSRGGSRTC